MSGDDSLEKDPNGILDDEDKEDQPTEKYW